MLRPSLAAFNDATANVPRLTAMALQARAALDLAMQDGKTRDAAAMMGASRS
jgi:hypothetical protein